METKQKLFIVGIDPGKNGGIVSITNGRITDITKMPPTPEDLVNHFLYLGFPNQPLGIKSYVIIENVHSMPTDGAKSAFSFGKQLGNIEGVLASFSIKPYRVSPQEWQSFFSIKRQDKQSKWDFKKMLRDESRRIAKTLELTMETCDAYLIALWFHKNQKKILKEK